MNIGSTLFYTYRDMLACGYEHEEAARVAFDIPLTGIPISKQQKVSIQEVSTDTNNLNPKVSEWDVVFETLNRLKGKSITEEETIQG